MWKLSITTSPEAEDAVAELLGRFFGSGVAAYTDVESSITDVAVYSKTRPGRLSARCADLRNGLARIKGCGLDIGRGKITVRKLPRKNWAESWNRHFKDIEIGDALLIKPSWSKRRPRRGQAVIVLDPGLSFGTGHHPTTLFCLRELARQKRCCDRQRPPGKIPGSGQHSTPAKRPRSFLDLGTGSGILAIAAAKLGYAPVHAVDSDSESVRVARANARANRVSDKIRVVHQDLTQLPLKAGRRYDLICANLLTTLLVAERERMIRWLKPGGVLVLAGILESEFDLVVRKYGASGFQLAAGRSEKEWRSGAFVR